MIDLRKQTEFERDAAYRKAIDNLARYKFFMFGYFAARWVTLNSLLGHADQKAKRANPFLRIVHLARYIRDAESGRQFPAPGTTDVEPESSD